MSSLFPTRYKQESVDRSKKDIDGYVVVPSEEDLPCFWEDKPKKKLADERKEVVDFARDASCPEFHARLAKSGYYQLPDRRWLRCFKDDEGYVQYNEDPECPFCFCKLNSFDCNNASCILDL